MLIVRYFFINIYMTSGEYDCWKIECFNRAVIAHNVPHIEFVVRETPDKIVIFGEKNKV